jgi:integrase/recombinase XerD
MVQPISIKFYLNELKAKGNKLPIYLRITVNRKKSEIFTTHSVPENEWDESKQRTKKNLVVNQSLNNTESEVYDIIHQLQKESKKITSIAIKNYLSKKDKINYGVIEYYDYWLENMRKANEVEGVTVDMYGYTQNYIQKFLTEFKKTNDTPIENVDFKFLSSLDLFLLTQKIGKSEKTLERNTVSKHHSRFRTVLINAMKQGYISKNPYVDFRLKKTPSKRTFLNEDELKSLIEHRLGENESLKRIRDIFVFSVYTGLRFEDAQQLTIDKIEKNKKGNYSLTIEQEKTNEPLAIPLFKEAVQIVRKYNSLPERKIFNKVLPSISNQKLNSYLKVIADMVGIKKNLSHHVARHTCATTILLSNEVPIEVVSKWLGHTNIKTTQVYAKITNTYLRQFADKIEKINSKAKKRKQRGR